MIKPVGTGQLFAESARTMFLRLTGSRYDSMRQRYNSGVIGELKKSGAWQAARDARKAKKNGLGAF